MGWQPRRFAPALVPLAVGLVWLGFGWRADLGVAILATLSGVMLIATGGAALLWAGDRQINYHMALTGLVSAVLAVICSPALGWIAIALLLGGLATFFVAGWATLLQHPVPAGIARPRASFALLRKIATDDALLGFFVNCARIPRGAATAADRHEIETLGAIARARGWVEQPAQYHRTPAAPDRPSLRNVRAARHNFEWLSFASGFTIDPELPGAARWARHTRNRRMGARVLRHATGQRPWLMCIHGYRMGVPALDFPLFDVAYWHRRGFNIIMPILPLHGPRRATWLTGGLFLDGPMVDLLHGESQALWDLRCCLAWIRAETPVAPIAVLGFSLGGYNAALLAAFEPELACVIAGIPLTDIPATLWHHLPGAHRHYLEANGITPRRASAMLAPVSPLHLAPKLAFERRFLFAATADQLVPPEQPLRLWEHWERPSMLWYHGSHLSVRQEPEVDRFIEAALRTTGLIGAGGKL